MDTRIVLSRRSLLKASSCLAAAAAIPAVGAIASPGIPDVLTTLLAEYSSAAEDTILSHARWNKARDEKAKAVEAAYLFFRWPDGTYGRIGDNGNRYHPEHALSWLAHLKTKALANSAGDEAAELRKVYAASARQIRRQGRRYEAIVATTEWSAAEEADQYAYCRFSDARDALRAYRPETMAEVAAIIRCASTTGPYPGTNIGLMMGDLADMIEAGVVA